MTFLFSKDTVVDCISNYPNFCHAMIAFKAHMKSCGWTVPYSGLGTGMGAYSVGDAVDTAALLYGAASSTSKNYQWFILRQPGSTRELCFQRTSMSDPTYWRIKFSPGGFGTAGSPSAIQTPTATDQVGIWGSGTNDASPGGWYLMSNSGSQRFHFCADDAAPYGFYMLGHAAGSQTLKMQMLWDPLKSGSYPASDLEPWVFSISGESQAWQFYMFNRETAPNTNDYGCYGYLGASSTPSNFVFINGVGYMIGGYLSSSPTMCMPYGIPNNPYNGKEDSIEIPYLRTSGFAAPLGYKGVGTMARWMGIARGLGITQSQVTSRDRYCIGHVTLPWDGSVPKI